MKAQIIRQPESVGKEDVSTNVRFKFPKDVYGKIKSYQRRLSADADRNVTYEEAVIEYIRKSKAGK